jgi:hypothetical protein
MRFGMMFMSVAALALLALAHPAAAQQSGNENGRVFMIISSVNPGPYADDAYWYRARQGTLTATVDGVECVTVDVRNRGAVPIVLGLPSQPEICGREGAEVILHNQYGTEMFERFTIIPGKTVTLANHAVIPSHSGAPAPAAAGSAGLSRSLRSGPGAAAALAGLAVVAFAGGLLLRRAS